LQEFAALGERGKIDEATAVVERLARGGALSIEQATALEAKLFGVVMDDPLMPPVLLAALARHFRWNEVGSALEQHRPDLYDRYLHRMGLALAWLDQMRELARQKDRAGSTARTLFLRPSLRVRLLGVGRYDEGLLEKLLRDARRYGPLLDGAIDPGMTDYLRNRIRAQDSVLRLFLRVLFRQPFFTLPLAAIIIGGIVGHFDLGPLWLRQEFGLVRHEPYDRNARTNENSGGWISFYRSIATGDLKASFSLLVAYGEPVAEIRYGTDKEIPDETYAFTYVEPTPTSPLPVDIILPRTTCFVSVQVRFKDGTASPVHRYDVPADMTK
jgi:hypothetical protein